MPSMLHISKCPREYTLVEDLEPHVDYEGDKTQEFRPKRSSRSRSLWMQCIPLVAIVVLSLMLGAVATTILYGKRLKIPIFSTEPFCKDPATRQEWRSLSHDEKHDYITAVQCLKEMPSRLGLNQSLYDDFPYIHSTIGDDTHGSGSFLPWHRYFIHIYEQALKEQCSYTHSLPYWDWSLDWLNLTAAPVWSSALGFGTDGNLTDHESIHGHCVTDGPFARLEVLYVEKFPYPHCLSRNFARGEALQNFSQAIRPAALHEMLKIKDFETFNLAVEDGPHLSIPRFVHGDFATITAPADPVFFLHHAQLDRLWWMWQQVDPWRRVGGSSGKGVAESNKAKALAREMLAYDGLALEVFVDEIVATESDVLCYRY